MKSWIKKETKSKKEKKWKVRWVKKICRGLRECRKLVFVGCLLAFWAVWRELEQRDPTCPVNETRSHLTCWSGQAAFDSITNHKDQAAWCMACTPHNGFHFKELSPRRSPFAYEVLVKRIAFRENQDLGFLWPFLALYDN